jgi:hypothetical protein
LNWNITILSDIPIKKIGRMELEHVEISHLECGKKEKQGNAFPIRCGDNGEVGVYFWLCLGNCTCPRVKGKLLSKILSHPGTKDRLWSGVKIQSLYILFQTCSLGKRPNKLLFCLLLSAFSHEVFHILSSGKCGSRDDSLFSVM